MAKKSKKKQLTLGHVKSATTTVHTTPAIKDVSTSANQGIVLVNQATMQKIYENSGTLAKANEFQTHYWALNFRHKADDGSILDISVPTVYFNYKQEVSSAAIDFDLKDVKEYSEKLEPIHHMKVNQLLQLNFKETLETTLGIPLEMIHSDVNSIHRHPGSSSSQRFSGTDLTKTSAEPGVVYPLASGIETANFAGIMAIDSGTNHVAHYEYRIASGTLGTDIQYTKGRCAAIIVDADRPVSAVERIMGIRSTGSYAKYDNCSNSALINDIHALARNLYLDDNFEAFTDSVSDTHLTQKTYAYGNYYNGTTYYGRNTSYSDKYKDYPYRYHSREALTNLPIMTLNDFYKALTYEDIGSVISTRWIATSTEAYKAIEDLQKKLGYTEETPYAKHPLRNIFKTVTQYNGSYAYNLREDFEKLAAYYGFTYKRSDIATSYDKQELLTYIEAVRKHYELNVKPEFPEPEKPSTNTSNIRPRATLTEDEKLDLEDAIEVVAKYSDFTPIDTAAVDSISIFELYNHLIEAEELYYGTEMEGEIYTDSREDYAMQIEFVQQLIQNELDDAIETIQLLSVDEEAVKALAKPETTDLSLEFMQEALSLYSVDQSILKALSYEKTKEMYDKVVQYH